MVVGGGPVGTRVARQSGEAGYETLVLEEHNTIGTPMQCAGLVSPRVIEMTGTKSSVLRSSKATIHPPDGEPLVLDAGEARAAVLDRKKFDREMADKAVKEGVEIRLGCRVTSSRLENGRRKVFYEHRGEHHEIEARIVVGADGPTSVIRRGAGFDGPAYLLAGIQALVGYETEEMHIYLGQDVAPGFFAWRMPHPDGTLIGAATEDGQAFDHLMRLLRQKGWESKIISYFAGTIPLGRLKNIVDDGLMLVGDAACQVKPLSGGGLYTGLTAADICARTIIDAFENGDTSREFLSRYDDSWQDELGNEISKGLWLRKIFKTLTDKQLNDLIDVLNNDRVKQVLEGKGDIDYPSTLAKPVLKTAPKLLKFAGPFIKGFF